MDSAGSAGVSAAGLHRRHTPNRHNGASAMNPNADDGETPNLGMERLAVVDSRERLGRSFGRTCLAVQDRATSSASVRHIGAVRRLATSVRGWFRMPGWSPGQRRRTGLRERKPAATAPQGGSRPVGAQSVWPSIPVDRSTRTAVCAQVMGGYRTFPAETGVGWRQR